LMRIHKKDLIDALNTSVQGLRQGVDMHCDLLTSLMNGQVDEGNLQKLLDLCPKRSRELRLEKAIQEAIEILEESRKAFKSKKLEALRKKLTQVLIDSD